MAESCKTASNRPLMSTFHLLDPTSFFFFFFFFFVLFCFWFLFLLMLMLVLVLVLVLVSLLVSYMKERVVKFVAVVMMVKAVFYLLSNL